MHIDTREDTNQLATAQKDIRLIKKLIIRAAADGGDPMLVLEAIGRITSEYDYNGPLVPSTP